MSAETRGNDVSCAHRFKLFRRWPIKIRWRCVKCGFTSRLYDGLDATMTRPVHEHMSVVVRGFNTVDAAGDVR